MIEIMCSQYTIILNKLNDELINWKTSEHYKSSAFFPPNNYLVTVIHESLRIGTDSLDLPILNGHPHIFFVPKNSVEYKFDCIYI